MSYPGPANRWQLRFVHCPKERDVDSTKTLAVMMYSMLLNAVAASVCTPDHSKFIVAEGTISLNARNSASSHRDAILGTR
ncbi:uncharacterized protein METZ01_LOCUS374674, partial [marine metagenome]